MADRVDLVAKIKIIAIMVLLVHWPGFTPPLTVGTGVTSTYTAGMTIPLRHEPITVGTDQYDLTHLTAFAVTISGKGIEKGTDLGVVVVFSCHVFTERAKHGTPHHVIDHYDARRSFDPVRYAMSQNLPQRIRTQIMRDALTFVSKSYSGNDNLILIEDEEGVTWTVVFCFQPLTDTETDYKGVRMEILSAHPKPVDQKKIYRKNISYFARKAIFDETRIPRHDK